MFHNYRKMVRPKCLKKVEKVPPYTIYIPAGKTLKKLDKNILSLEEFSAMKLSNEQMCSMREGAQVMQISPATFQRLKARGQSKICDAICNGKAIEIDINYPLTSTLMPNQDGTGPDGAGSQTGRAMGRCSGTSNSSQNTNQGFRNRRNQGQGRGLGRRKGR